MLPSSAGSARRAPAAAVANRFVCQGFQPLGGAVQREVGQVHDQIERIVGEDGKAN